MAGETDGWCDRWRGLPFLGEARSGRPTKKERPTKFLDEPSFLASQSLRRNPNLVFHDRPAGFLVSSPQLDGISRNAPAKGMS